MIQAFITGNVQEATRIHLELLPLFKVLFMTTNPIPLKAALELMGWNVGEPRLPLVPLSSENRSLLKAVLDELQLLPKMT